MISEIPLSFFAVQAFLFGSLIGSFSNVVIHRVPIGVSIVRPSSACPACGTSLSWFDNIPILSWLALRGRCRSCKKAISARYPLVEALVGTLWAALVFRFGISPELPAYLAMSAVLVILSAIDLEHRRIPNKILGPSMVLSIALLSGATVILGTIAPLLSGLIGAIAYFLPMLAIGLISPKGMGFGDIKFSAYLGLHLGWLGLGHVFVGAFLGFFLGSVVGVLAIAVGGRSRKDFIPFGPSMAAGALAAIFLGEPLLRFWLA